MYVCIRMYSAYIGVYIGRGGNCRRDLPRRHAGEQLLYICPDATMYVSSCSLKTAHTDPILAHLDSPVYINIDR
jgi:hypothetical protein